MPQNTVMVKTSSNLQERTRPLFTVFTPTYNRAHTLGRLYLSLKEQTLLDFEWIVVDDGSSDDTCSLVESWKSESSSFPIRYFYQANRGKHVATNYAVREAFGFFFIILDSDDTCVPEALERFAYHWQAIDESNRGRSAE